MLVITYSSDDTNFKWFKWGTHFVQSYDAKFIILLIIYTYTVMQPNINLFVHVIYISNIPINMHKKKTRYVKHKFFIVAYD